MSGKYQEVYLKADKRVAELTEASKRYAAFDNPERRYQSPGGRNAAEVYHGEGCLALTAY